jgi:hypothetical protein
MSPDRQHSAAASAAAHPHQAPSLVRRWSLNASVRKAALEEVGG